MSDAPSGHLVALALKAALGPLEARLALLTERVATLEPLVGTMRERVAVTEAREPIPGPPGPAGADGAKGADGLGCDALVLDQDDADAGLLTLAYTKGDARVPLGTVRLPIVRYSGVYEAGRAYVKGEQVTYQGSLWHCEAPTRERPGTDGDGWVLQVKRGGGR
jgi:hypothetical protein